MAHYEKDFLRAGDAEGEIREVMGEWYVSPDEIGAALAAWRERVAASTTPPESPAGS
jgi:hypothetical protein